MVLNLGEDFIYYLQFNNYLWTNKLNVRVYKGDKSGYPEDLFCSEWNGLLFVKLNSTVESRTHLVNVDLIFFPTGILS